MRFSNIVFAGSRRLIFDSLTFRHWGRQPLRTALVVAAIALGVASTIVADLTGTFAARAIRVSILGTSTEAALQIVGIGRSVDRALVPRLADVAGVANVRPALDGSVVLRGPHDALGRVVRLQGVDSLQVFPGSDALRTYNSGPFGPPQRLDLAMTAGRGAVVSASLASDLALNLGSRVVASARGTTTPLLIAGIEPTSTLGLDPNAAIVDIATADAILHARGALSRIDLMLVPGAREAHVERDVSSLLPPSERVVEPERRIAALERLASSFTLNLDVLAAATLALAALLVANALGISVRRRAHQIATLRALGATRWQIFLAFIVEGAMLGVAGGMVGVLIGDAVARLASGHGDPKAVFETGAQNASDVIALVRGASLGVALATIGAIAPALAAASVLPVRAWSTAPVPLPHRRTSGLALAGIPLITASLVVGRLAADAAHLALVSAAALAFVAGATLCVPVLLAAVERAPLRAVDAFGAAAVLTIANVRATAARMTLAIIVLVVAVASGIGVATASASFRTTVARWVTTSTPGDLVVRPDPGANPLLPAVLRAQLARVPGVVAVGSSRRINVPFREEAVALDAFDARTLAARGLTLGPGDVAVSREVAQHFGLRSGDALAFGGGAPLHVRSVVDDHASLAGGFTVDAATGAALVGNEGADALYLDVRPGVPLARVRAAAISTAAPLAVDVATSAQTRASEEASFARPLALASAIAYGAIAIAITSTASTSIAAVAERRRELMLLRIVGLSLGSLRVMIAYEAVLVSTVGAAVGAVAGLALGAMLVLELDPGVSGTAMIYAPPLATLAVTFAAVVTVAFATAPLTARAAAARVSTVALEAS